LPLRSLGLFLLEPAGPERARKKAAKSIPEGETGGAVATQCCCSIGCAGSAYIGRRNSVLLMHN
jgi:hypothetical protein